MRRFLTIRRAGYLALMLLALYGILPHIPNLLISTSTLRAINPYLVGLSVCFLGASYIFSAAEYCVLSNRRLPYLQTIIAQMAATFADRLLPAGSGALGVNYLYLRQQQFSGPRAIAIVATNNILGVIGHIVLLTVALVTFPSVLRSVRRPEVHIWQWALGVGILTCLVLAILVVVPRLRSYLQKLLSETFRALLDYWHQPLTTLPALALSMGLTLSYVACLYTAALACGVTITPLQAFIALTVGVTAATIVPTPGGLGGAETGITVSLVTFGLHTHNAFTVALLYRLITFWLALVTGAVAFIWLEQRNYIQLPRHTE